ncbi:hypothetical protein E2C01_041274 [Portunus trituberculatus]|uniref:Uncharacterized protein n=1 Tax=Portunus trituberculatus TaxID=210409 RepID=A0A5B7FPZ5_PORTR|nr:hypothetical protein [Portunus trituberculatus]
MCGVRPHLMFIAATHHSPVTSVTTPSLSLSAPDPSPCLLFTTSHMSVQCSVLSAYGVDAPYTTCYDGEQEKE